MLPHSVAASSENADVPGADVPFLQSTASGLCRVAVHRPSARCASYVTPLMVTTSAQPVPHGLTVHMAAVFPGEDTPLTTTLYLPLLSPPPSAQLGVARPTAVAPNKAATATVRSILNALPLPDPTLCRVRAIRSFCDQVVRQVAGSTRSSILEEDKGPPHDHCPRPLSGIHSAGRNRPVRSTHLPNRREQNAVKAKIVDCAGCAHKREPLVKGT